MNATTLNLRIMVTDDGSVKIRQLGDELKGTGDKGKSAVSGMESAFSGLRTTIGAVATAVGGISLVMLVKQISNVMDEYTNLESRLKLVTKSSEEFAAAQQSLYDISLKSHVAYAETVKLYTSISRATQAMGKSSALSQSQTLQLTETINQALIVSGASSASSEAALVQLGQGLASGVLRGEEFNSVMEQTPRLAQALADGLGVNIGQLRLMANQGQLTTDVVTSALLSQREKVEGEFKQMKETISQAWTDLETVVKNFVHEADKSGDSTGAMVGSIKDLAATIETNKGAILSLFSGIMTLSSEAIEAVSGLVRSVQGLAIVAASSDKTLLDWITASREDMKTWQAEVANGTAYIKDQIADLLAKKDEVNRRWIFTAEAKAAQVEESAGIDKIIDGLKMQIAMIELKNKAVKDTQDSVAHLAVVEEEAAAKEKKRLESQLDAFAVNAQWAITHAKDITDAEAKANDEREKNEKKRLEESLKANEKHADELKKLDQEMTEAIIKNSDVTYSANIAALKKEMAEKREMIGANQVLLEKSHQYEQAKIQELGEFKTMYASREQDRIKKITDAWQVSAESQVQITKEQYAKQEALEKQLETYFEYSADNKLATEMSRLTRTYNAELTAAADRIDLQDRVKEKYAIQQQAILDKHNETLQAMKEAWKTFGTDVTNNFTSVLSAGLKGEYNSLGEAWQSLTDKMLDSFVDLIAKIAVAWAESEVISWFTGTSGSFNISDFLTTGNKSGTSSSSSSSSAGSTVGGLATTAATAYAKDYIYTEGVKPAATAAYDAIASYAAGSSGAAETGAATGGAVAAETGSTAAAEAGTAGTGLSSLAGPLALVIYGITSSIEAGKVRWEDMMNQAAINPTQIAAVAGTNNTGTLTTMTAEATKALSMVTGGLSEMSAISVDAASGIVVMATSIGAQDGNGLAGTVDWSIGTFDNATGAWVASATSFNSLLATMKEMDPVADDAIQASARYVAEMAGVPSVADELAIAFEMSRDGIASFASGALTGADIVGTAAGLMADGSMSAADAITQALIDLSGGVVDSTSIMSAAADLQAGDTAAASTIIQNALYELSTGAASGADIIANAERLMSDGSMSAADAIARAFADLSGNTLDSATAISAASAMMTGDTVTAANVMTAAMNYMAGGSVYAAGTIADAISQISGTAGDLMTTVNGVLADMSSINWASQSVASDGNSYPDFTSSLSGSQQAVAAQTAAENVAIYYGDTWNEGGMAAGGVVKRLMVPTGDDGWGPLSYGEGVIDEDTMAVLSAAIRSGKIFGGSSDSNGDISAMLYSIAASTQKTAKILSRFEYTGIPQSSSEAVA